MASSVSKNKLRDAVRVLRAGGVIAFPTETTYGLGCDPRNTPAVRRIFKLKERAPKKPLLLVAASVAQASKVVKLSAREIIAKHWPGPLTIILPIKRPTKLARGVVMKGEVAIRVSSHPLVQELARRFGFPIVATSANRSDQPAARSARAVHRAFGDKLDLILDSGTLPKRRPSTVIRVKKDGSIEVIRAGAIRL